MKDLNLKNINSEQMLMQYLADDLQEIGEIGHEKQQKAKNLVSNCKASY